MTVECVTIDLQAPIEPLQLQPGTRRLFALLTWGSVPLGKAEIDCKQGQSQISAPVLQEAIGKAAWPLWEQGLAGQLERLGAVPDAELPPISVVVCTRDRAASLAGCLAALQALDYPRFEVVVVDNCSAGPETAETVRRTPFRYVREDRPGLDWARNRGAAEARHAIVAYIDDDALATPGWLRGIAAGFDQPDVMAVTGLVLPAELGTAAQRAFQAYGGMGKGFRRFRVEPERQTAMTRFWASGWGVGANMAFRRELFAAIGGFDEALDVGTATNGGGDIEFFYRVVAHGHVLQYEPAALVRHVDRREMAALRRQVYNNGRSFAAFLLTIWRNEPRRRLAVLRFGLRMWVWEHLIRSAARALKRRKLSELRLAAAEIRGSLDGPRGYRAAQAAAARLRAGGAT